ncbi:hypothetical protein ACKI1Q_42655, partial [Streptomyces galilaeus]
MDGFGESGVGLFGPVVGELVVVAIGEVVRGGVSEEGLGEVEADAEAACVHRCFLHCFGGRAGVPVAVEEFGRSGQIVGHPPVGSGPGESVVQQSVAVLGKGGGRGQGLGVEGVRDGEGAAGEHFPRAVVRVLRAGCGQGRVLVGVLRPEGAQDQNRRALRADQQLVHGRCDLLTDRPVTEIVLGFVQPHHRTGPDTVEVFQGGLRA